MDKFGLTEQEKGMHLHHYNHALFRNQMFFLEIEWEINMLTGTVVVLEDKNEPERSNREYSFEDILHGYLEKRIINSERKIFERYLTFESLQKLDDEVAFDLHLKICDEEGDLHRIVLTPAFDEEHKLYCVYLAARNLQPEVRRERAVYESKEQFRNALMSNTYFHFSFDVTGDGLIYEDYVTRDGRHLVQELTGMELPVPFEVFIEKWFELYEPQFDERQGEEVFTADYLQKAFMRNEQLIEFEVKLKEATGAETASFMQVFIVLIEKPEDKHIHADVIWRDISAFRRETLKDNMELRSYNEELKRTISQEEQYRLASLSDALLVYTINLTRNQIEQEFYEIVDGQRIPMLELVGLEPPCDFGEFCKRWCEANVFEESRNTFLNMFNRRYMLDAYAKGERHLEIEFDTVLGRGIRVTLRNTAFLVEDKQNGDILAMVNSKDVSKQREEEKRQREALRHAYETANNTSSAKTDFLMRMSHDIRTPMNSIVGMTAIAERHLDDKERVADCLKNISVSGKYLLTILSEVLDMSKIESGKMKLQEKSFNLSDLIDNIFAICKIRVREKHHDLSASFQGIEHENVLGDSQRLQQAFMNIMDNSIKYTPSGGRINLSVTEKKSDLPNMGCYEFVIEDNGIGMSKDFLPRLFKPFIRSDDRRVTKIQGSGLGMPIAKNIVQMMNGLIDVKSEPEEGTRVTMTVMLKFQEDSMNVRFSKFSDAPLLIVGQDKESCDSICDILAELELQGEWIPTEEEAVDKIVERRKSGIGYKVIFFDWGVSDKSSVEATKKLREAAGDSVPIIICSEDNWVDVEVEAKAAGATTFIGKPIFKSLLIHLFKMLTEHVDERGEKSAIELLEEQNFSGHRVLLVEDNDPNAEITKEILEMTGIQVEHAWDGREAVEKISLAEDGHYDIVFMDIQMPVMDGYEATKEIRGMDRDYAKNVPIYAISANAFAEDIQKSKDSGMNGHIVKPMSLDRLVNILSECIGTRE